MTFDFNSPFAQMSASAFSALSSHAYHPNDPAPAGFTKLAITTQGTYDLIHPEVWQDSQGNVIIAFRGTAPGDANDLAADVTIMNGQVPLAAEQAAAFAEEIIAGFANGTKVR